MQENLKLTNGQSGFILAAVILNNFKPLIILTFATAVVCVILFGIFGTKRQAETDNTVSEKVYSRIITLNPNITEIVYALGCEDIIAGVGDFCDYPPDAKNKPCVGGIINPSFEKILSLSPDLIIVAGVSEGIKDFCSQRKIEILRLQLEGTKNLYESILTIGQKLNCRRQADELVNTIRTQLDEVSRQVADFNRPRVFFSMNRIGGSLTQLGTAGGGTSIGELIEIAGGENIFAQVDSLYPVVSKESLLRRDPQVIIEPVPGGAVSSQMRGKLLADWAELSGLSAVKNGRIYFPDENFILRPGPRIGLIARELANMIHEKKIE